MNNKLYKLYILVLNRKFKIVIITKKSKVIGLYLCNMLQGLPW